MAVVGRGQAGMSRQGMGEEQWLWSPWGAHHCGIRP